MTFSALFHSARLRVFSVTIATVFFACATLAQEAYQASPSVHAQIEAALKAMQKTQSVGHLTVSQDGKWLAWIENGKSKPQIVVGSLDAAGKLGKGRAIELAEVSKSDNCTENDPVWAPDSRHLGFFAACGTNAQANLYVAEIGGKTKARRLTDLKGYVDSPAFSPDGSRVAFLYVEGATRPAGAVAAMKPPAGVIGEDGIEIERLAVARVDASKPSAPEQISPLSLHVYEFDWAPDSKALAYVAAAPPGENNWWVAKLYMQAVTTDGVSAPHVLLAPSEVSGALHGLQIAVPRWAPDGRRIAFIGGLMSDQGATGGDVFLMDTTAERGAMRNLTTESGSTSTAEWIEWAGNLQIDVSELAGGNTQLERLTFGEACSVKSPANPSAPAHPTNDAANTPSCPTGTRRRLIANIPATGGDGRMAMSLSATGDHTLYIFQASSYDHAPEIFAVHTEVDRRPSAAVPTSLGELMQLTHLNDNARPAWGKAESLNWKNEGFDVQGWLLWPVNYDPSKRYPMIVSVHGGPSAAATSRWGMSGSLSTTMLSAMGYFVLAPNPRGSYGQGERFTQANRKDFGYGDLRDILAGVDAVLAKYPVDANRVGIEGWSYGGFMTMFAGTQTGYFHAAVAGAGISNWQSYYGENSIDQWMTPFFGASVYDDPAVYAKSSAINFIHQAHTPTLVVVGDRDGECPAPQSFEFWHALRDQHVPSQLVVYPNEGHGFADAGHRRDVLERSMEWFARYLPAQ